MAELENINDVFISEEEDDLPHITVDNDIQLKSVSPSKSTYNPRDPAGAQASSAFSAAFSNLKKSKFYEDPKDLIAACSTAQGRDSGGGDKPTAAVGRPIAPGAQRQAKSGPLLVSPRQRGNPLLKAICNVPWEYEEIIPDYQMGATTCALFLSLRYHNLNPDYIHERLKKLGKKFKLQVLVVQVDLVDPNHAIKHLNRLCLLADLTLMLAGSPEEAGRIIETYKMFENKPPDMIMEKKEEGMQSKVLNALTAVRSVNKTDAYTLLRTFETLENILRASPDALELCPGFGPQKAQRLHAVLHQAFLRRA